MIVWVFKIDSFGMSYYTPNWIYIGIVDRDDRLNADFGRDHGAEYFKIRPKNFTWVWIDKFLR